MTPRQLPFWVFLRWHPKGATSEACTKYLDRLFRPRGWRLEFRTAPLSLRPVDFAVADAFSNRVAIGDHLAMMRLTSFSASELEWLLSQHGGLVPQRKPRASKRQLALPLAEASPCRGFNQGEALIELERRRLWLIEEQQRQAGLSAARDGSP